MTGRSDVVTEAREWLGTRWHHQASVKGVGTDCVGLVGGVALALGIPGSDEWRTNAALHNYGRQPSAELLEAAAERLLNPIAFADAVAGDIVLFRFNGDPTHFAILTRTDPAVMIHAYAQARRVVENRLDDLWRSRVVRAYSYPGIE